MAEEIPAIVQTILKNRGFSELEMSAYLFDDYETGLHDPFLMLDMDKAVGRILRVVEEGHKVVIYGDYDVDGITSSTVLAEGLAHLGIDAECFIPDRFIDGYGMNVAAIKRFAADGVNLIVTVDCGITNIAEIRLANEFGVDVIVTDHHAVPEELPPALAVINPKRPGDLYPFKELCGAGVAFKLVQALQKTTGVPVAGQEKWLLDLVALGTVADVVPLIGENRVLAKYGLMVMRKTRRAGLRRLADVAGINVGSITSGDLGFIFGPRLNAAGRLHNAAPARELLCCQNDNRAGELAAMLDGLNAERRAEQERIFALADEMAKDHIDSQVLVLAGEGWPHGIVGIVAAKLAEKWRKPVLVAEILDDIAKGSARSVPGFSIIEALRNIPELFLRFGGHEAAAGFTFSLSNIDEIRAALDEQYSRAYHDSVLTEAVADYSVDGLAGIGWEVYEQLLEMEPFGEGNRAPVLELKNTKIVQWSAMGQKRNHVKAIIGDGNGNEIVAIGYGLAEMFTDVDTTLSLTIRGELNKNVFQGRASLQLKIAGISIEQD